MTQLLFCDTVNSFKKNLFTFNQLGGGCNLFSLFGRFLQYLYLTNLVADVRLFQTFDCVPHGRLIRKLIALGIKSITLTYKRAFLTDKKRGGGC